MDEDVEKAIKRKGKKKPSDNLRGKCAHRIYGNPSKKKPFVVSQSQCTDDDLISQRLQSEWFERAQFGLRYF